MNNKNTVESKVLAILRECPETRYDDMQLKCIEEIRRRFGKDSIRNGVLCQNLWLPPEKAEITMPTGMIG